MKILTRYHLKEYFFYTFCFFVVFSSIITFIRGIFTIQKLYEFNPTFQEICLYFYLIFLQLLSFTYPLAAFFGVLFAIHRFKEEKEFLGFLSLGFKISDFLKPLALFTLISFFLVFIFNFYILPWTKREQKLMRFELLKRQSERSIREKTPVLIAKQCVLYVEKAQKEEEKQKLKRVFMIDQTSAKKQIFFSEEGILDLKNNTLTLLNGQGFSLDPKKEIEFFSFKKYTISLALNKGPETLEFGRGELPFHELKEKIKTLSPNTTQYNKYITEYWERLLYPFLTIFLMFQCVLLGLWIKFHHRFLVFFTGIVFYIGFYMIYQLFKALAENGKIYPLYAFVLCYILLILILSFQIFVIKKIKHKIWL